MKKISLFPAIVIFGIGLYYSLQKFEIYLFEHQSSWQFLLILLGFAFLISGHFEKDNTAILPGITLVGLGIHFIYHGRLNTWPDHAPAFLFILAVSFLLTSLKTKNGASQGVILFLLALILHFLQRIIDSLSFIQAGVTLLETYWPFLFLLVGGFLLYRTRKRG
ncbi:hypothetical protein [Bacillus weihaiensis]|uniref:DUF5668 domain-containing protein n=1 Tax=Bacillus weihaiensis TaxID=1547283 RepID=A0A1L3MPE4_9BACI|nr:hypothetical protein [Bacillus weihaiensis]APH04199.1 hypothetical protein A9C19_05275 [Bacillus weihaiensis]